MGEHFLRIVNIWCYSKLYSVFKWVESHEEGIPKKPSRQQLAYWCREENFPILRLMNSMATKVELDHHVMSCSKIESVAIDERNDKAITDYMCNSGSSQDTASSATSSLKKNQ